MGEELAHFFKKKKERPDVREAKHAYRQPHKEHAESTGEGNRSIHPAQQTRQNYRQQFKGSEEEIFNLD